MKLVLILLLSLPAACATLSPGEREAKAYCKELTGQDTEPQYSKGTSPAAGIANIFIGWGEARRKRRAMDQCMHDKGYSMFQYKTPREIHYPHSTTYFIVRATA